MAWRICGLRGRASPLSHRETRVPLAIPIEKNGVRNVEVRVRPRDWNAAKPAEARLVVLKDKTYVDRYRARLIAATIHPKYSFDRHLAQKYADEAVLGILAKMLDIDNERIAAGIVFVLARQEELPASTGESLAAAVRRWGTDDSLTSLGVPRQSLFWAALNTRNESARQAVLEFLKSPDPQLLSRTADTLSQSQGDAVWLRRARDSIAAVEKEARKDAEAAKLIAKSHKHLDERIQKARP